MPESFQEQRRRELGLTPDSSPVSSENEIGFQTKRMMDLGMIPDTRMAPEGTLIGAPDISTQSSVDYGPPLKKTPWLAQVQEDIYNNTIGPIQDKLMRFATSATDVGNSKEIMKENPITRDIFGSALDAPQTSADKVADVAGSLYGVLGGGEASYLTGGKLAAKGIAKLAPNAAGWISNAARGVGAGLAYGTGREALEASTGQDEAFTDRLKDVGLDAALFGVGDVALSAAAPYVETGLKKIIGRFKPEPIAEEVPTLALPSSRLDTRIQTAFERSKVDVGESPIAPGDYDPNALPSPTLESPTFARIGERAPNPYAVKLDELFATAREEGLPPGREREALEDLWSRMAGPQDPGLDQLIELATPTLKQMDRLTPKPGMIGRARELQGQREAYGVGMPVKSLTDRYTGGVVGDVAPTIEKVGFKLKNKPLNIESRGNALNADAMPAELLNAEDVPDLIPISKLRENELLDGADNWKDKNALSLGRETMQRNFEDVMGKDAPKMIQTYLDPVKQSEAERIRFVNQQRNEVKNLGIKYKSKEDELVQKYGEGLITPDELKVQTPNYKQVIKTAENMRRRYDGLLNTVNKVLTENGYPTIPKRENYFPHYQEVDGLLSKFGLSLENHTLPTDINGLSADFKPGKNFFANALRRKGNQTDYGFIRGFDRYIEGVSKLIHQIPNIKRLRGLEKGIRSKYEGDTHLSNLAAALTEYTNVIAGKKSMVDRAAESLVGRNLYKVVDGIRKRVGANMIGGSVSSALTNFIPLTQALATTNKKAFVEGMGETISNIFKDDGFVQKSDFLTRRIGSDPLGKSLWDKSIEKAGWLFKTLDNFTSQIIVRGKYNEGLSKNMEPDEALRYADDWAARMMADRSVGQMPNMFNSRTLGLLTQFQLEVNNQVSFLFKDLPRTYNKPELASALGQVFIYSYLFNELYEKVTGQRPAFDPIGVGVKAVEDFTNPNLAKMKASTNLWNNAKNNLPFVSVLSGGRMPIQAAIPSVSAMFENDANISKELTKPLYYLIPPVGGGQIKKTVEGISAFNKNIPGIYGENSKGEEFLRYPIESTKANKLRATLFGPGSLPETNDYYRNDLSPLTPEMTKSVEKSSNPSLTYDKMMVTRQRDKIKNQLDEIKKDKKMSSEKKAEMAAKLRQRLEELSSNAK